MMNVNDALIAADDLTNQFRGYIRAACKGHADYSPEDVRQSLALIAVELPEALNVTTPAARRTLIETAIRAARPSTSSQAAEKGHPISTADRFMALPTSVQARIRSAVLADGSTDYKPMRRRIEQAIRAYRCEDSTIRPIPSAADHAAELNGRTVTSTGIRTPDESIGFAFGSALMVLPGI